MSAKTPLSQMTTWDLITLVIQIGIVIVSIILAVQGDTSALLGLGALAGGSKGSLLVDILKLSKRGASKTLLVLVMLSVLVVGGCSGAFGAQWVVESKSAVLATAKPYIEGCQQVTIAPVFSVAWESADVAFGGGVLVGCMNHGQLLEFRCVAAVVASGEYAWRCLPLATWEKMAGEVE